MVKVNFTEHAHNLINFGYTYFYEFPDNIISVVNSGFEEFINQPIFYKDWWRLDMPGQVNIGYDSEEITNEQVIAALKRDEKICDINIIETFKYRDSFFSLADDGVIDFKECLSWMKNMRLLQFICKTITNNILEGLNGLTNGALKNGLNLLKDEILNPKNDNHFIELSSIGIEEIVEASQERGLLTFKLFETHSNGLYFGRGLRTAPYQVPDNSIMIVLGKQGTKRISSSLRSPYIGGDFRGNSSLDLRKSISCTISLNK